MTENFIDETKDAEQIAMEMQTAYLSGEEGGEMPTAYRGKGKTSSKGKGKGFKGKGFGKSKGKGYGKGSGKKDTNPDQENCPWKIDERSWKN